MLDEYLMQIKNIQTKIYEIRNQQVMLDFDLADIYKTETRVLKQTVKRNIDRFPKDFMFVLSESDIAVMVSQSVIPSKSYFGGARPFAFTEQGVAMLSSVLKTKNAVRINITIMRAFVVLRQFALTNENLTRKLKELEDKFDKKFNDVYEVINFLLQTEKQNRDIVNREKIGYKK
jgi:hypothetical protein